MKRYSKIVPIVLFVPVMFMTITFCKGKTPQTEEEIDVIFIKKCAGCHGTDGVPNIPGAPDFTDPKFHSSHTDEQLLKSITDGKDPRMPAYGEILEKEEIQALVPYIRNLAKKPEKSSSKNRKKT